MPVAYTPARDINYLKMSKEQREESRIQSFTPMYDFLSEDLFSDKYVTDRSIEDWYEPDRILTDHLRTLERQFPEVKERTQLARYASLMPYKTALQFPNLASGKGYWTSKDKIWFTFVQMAKDAISAEAKRLGDDDTLDAIRCIGVNFACNSPFRPDVIHTEDFQAVNTDFCERLFPAFAYVFWKHALASFDKCLKDPSLVKIKANRSSGMGVKTLPDGTPITNDCDPKTGIFVPMPTEPMIWRKDMSRVRLAFVLDRASPYGSYQIAKREVEEVMTEGGEWTTKNMLRRIMFHLDNTGGTGIRWTSQDPETSGGRLDERVLATKSRPFEVEIKGYRNMSGLGNNEALSDLYTKLGYVGKVCNQRRFFPMRADNQVATSLWAKAFLHEWEEGPSFTPSLNTKFLYRYRKFLETHPDAVFFTGDRHNAEKFITTNKKLVNLLVPFSALRSFIVDLKGAKILGSRMGHRFHEFAMASGEGFTTFWNVVIGCATKIACYVMLMDGMYHLTHKEQYDLAQALSEHLLGGSQELRYRDVTFCLAGSTDDIVDIMCRPGWARKDWVRLADEVGLPDLDKDWQLETEIKDSNIGFGLRFTSASSGKEPGVEYFQSGPLKHAFDLEHLGIAIFDETHMYERFIQSGYADVINKDVIHKMNWAYCWDISVLAESARRTADIKHAAGIGPGDDVNPYSPADMARFESQILAAKGGLTSDDPFHDALDVPPEVKGDYLRLAEPLLKDARDFYSKVTRETNNFIERSL